MTNRTGIKTSPIHSRRMIDGAEEANTVGPDDRALETERVRWARDADPVGTIPPPGSLKGLAKTAVEALRGRDLHVFVDKLGERLAYERTGTRLYEALFAKLDAAHVHADGPTRAELEKIRDDEHHHLLVLHDAIDQMGGDPTALTPSADVIAVAGAGWIQVLADPRTTFTQCLEVMLIAESGDIEGWTMLVELAVGLGLDDLAEQFRRASIVEEEHVLKVRAWLTAALLGQAGAIPTSPRAHV